MYQVLQIDIGDNDPLYQAEGVPGVTAEDVAGPGEWASSKIVRSRTLACKNLPKLEQTIADQKVR